jgi:hypothetical protein
VLLLVQSTPVRWTYQRSVPNEFGFNPLPSLPSVLVFLGHNVAVGGGPTFDFDSHEWGGELRVAYAFNVTDRIAWLPGVRPAFFRRTMTTTVTGLGGQLLETKSSSSRVSLSLEAPLFIRFSHGLLGAGLYVEPTLWRRADRSALSAHSSSVQRFDSMQIGLQLIIGGWL